MAQKSQNTNVSMEIVESLNPSGLDFIKDFYREFTQLLDKYVQLAEGASLFKSDKNRRLERTHLVTLIKGQELDSYVLKDLNTFNIYRNLNPGPVASTVELYRQLSESQKENMRSHFLKNSLVRDPQVDIDTLREVEKIKKLADSLRQRNVHFLGLVAFQSLAHLRDPTKIVNSDKSQRFLQSYTNNGVNLLHQFHITVNQFVDSDDDVAAPPVKEHKRKRRAIRIDDDGNKVEHPSEKRRRLQIHFIRESLWSILGQLGLQRSAFANKLPTTSFDSDNNWAGTVNFEGWPKETTNRSRKVVRCKALNESLCNFDRASLDAIQDYLVNGWIKALRPGIEAGAISKFRDPVFSSKSTDIDQWEVSYIEEPINENISEN